MSIRRTDVFDCAACHIDHQALPVIGVDFEGNPVIECPETLELVLVTSKDGRTSQLVVTEEDE